MEQAAGCRILAIIGSGETSPTMVTVLASAAAATAGFAAVPVYEIYKAGAPPHWLDGLDLLGAPGLNPPPDQ